MPPAALILHRRRVQRSHRNPRSQRERAVSVPRALMKRLVPAIVALARCWPPPAQAQACGRGCDHGCSDGHHRHVSIGDPAADNMGQEPTGTATTRTSPAPWVLHWLRERARSSSPAASTVIRDLQLVRALRRHHRPLGSSAFAKYDALHHHSRTTRGGRACRARGWIPRWVDRLADWQNWETVDRVTRYRSRPARRAWRVLLAQPVTDRRHGQRRQQCFKHERTPAEPPLSTRLRQSGQPRHRLHPQLLGGSCSEVTDPPTSAARRAGCKLRTPYRAIINLINNLQPGR
jgi:hypothetical protein